MVSKQVLLMMAIVGLVVVQTLGENYFVGDKVGWTVGVDYSGWAEGKQFHVGDNLVFNYFPGAHNVVVVNGTEYKKCSASSSASTFTTGGDIIQLTVPGETGYICTFGSHCSNGMRLLINVASGSADAAAAPHTAPSTSKSSSYVSSSSMIAAVSIVAAAMI